MTRRSYTKRVRADKEAATRTRILDAALQLWAEIGPAAASITAIAQRARVQRLTIYRHFGDDAALRAATWKHFEASSSSPDPAAWAAIGDSAKRLRRAIRSLYAWYRANRSILERVLPEARHLDALADALADHRRYADGIVATLETGWSPRGKSRKPLLAAALEHAVRFSTWKSLADAGLDDRQAARLIERLIRALARRSRR
jgi:AcrR family transcriptional regulator